MHNSVILCVHYPIKLDIWRRPGGTQSCMNIFHCLFCRVSPKEEQPLIFTAQPVWGVTVFFVNLWVYMVIPEQPQTSTAVSAWGRGALFPPHRLCKIKNHSLRSHNFLLKHNFFPVHLLLCCRENAGVIVGLAWTMFFFFLDKLSFAHFYFQKRWITSPVSLYGCYVSCGLQLMYCWMISRHLAACLSSLVTQGRE